MSAPEVSVVVPVFRNEECLAELHARLEAALAPASFELLFVDDASPDGSRALLLDLAARDPRVGVLALGRNGGQHRAVLAGLAHARGRRAVLLDADLQDPPEAIPALLAALGPGCDIVFAGRRGRYESAGRLATSRLFKSLLHVVAGVPRDAGMFVALSRRAVDALVSAGDPAPFVVALLGETGLPMRSIPVERSVRPRGDSSVGSRLRLAIGVHAILHTLRRRLARPRSSPSRAEVVLRAGGPFAR